MSSWGALRGALDGVVRSLRGAQSDTPRVDEPHGAEGPTPALRAQLARCTCCGICDARYDAFDRLDRGTVRSIASLVRDSARGRDPIAREAARWRAVARGDLAALEVACPVAVPFPAVAATFATPDGATSGAARAPASSHDPG